MTGYHKLGPAAVLVVLLQGIAAPAIATGVLMASTFLRGVPFNDGYVALAIISALLFFLFLRAQLSGTLPGLISGWTIATGVTIAWAGVVAVVLLIGYATKTSAVYSRQALLLWFIATPPLVTGSLIVLRQWLRWALNHSGQARAAVIAGVNENSLRLADKIKRRPELGLRLLGFFDDRAAERLGGVEDTPLLGRFSDLPEYAQKNALDVVFIAIPTSQVKRARDLLSSLRDTTASVYFVPDVFVFDLIQARADDLFGIPVVAICETPFQGWRGVMKRLSDIVLALLMLLVALPTMAIVALAIKLTSPGHVLFQQRRYGLDGEEIIVYKFRTMTVAEDGDKVVQARKDDDRITPLGQFLRRYSLDELPQLINVLQGRMSMVGPRPHAVAHNEEYRKLIPGYMIRHKVPPGITGLAQVNGCRGETPTLEAMEKRVQYDLQYLTQWSLLLDIKILLRTLAIMFRDEKAY